MRRHLVCAGLIGAAISGAGLLLLNSTPSSPGQPVTELEARRALHHVEAAAAHGDTALICTEFAAARSICEGAVVFRCADQTGATLPVERPRVVASRAYNAAYAAAWLLQLEGEDAQGRTYESDFLVLRHDDGAVRVQTPIYRGGTTITDSSVAGPQALEVLQ